MDKKDKTMPSDNQLLNRGLERFDINRIKVARFHSCHRGADFSLVGIFQCRDEFLHIFKKKRGVFVGHSLYYITLCDFCAISQPEAV